MSQSSDNQDKANQEKIDFGYRQVLREEKVKQIGRASCRERV